MRNPLFQAICRVGMFMICAQAIVHFRPNEAYEKYLKLLVRSEERRVGKECAI